MKTSFNTLWLPYLMMLVFTSAAQAAEVQVPVQTRLHQEGNIMNVEGMLTTSASRLAVWKLLTDYTRFPQFVPGIHSNRILEQRNGFKLIEQRGTLANSQFQMPYQGVIQVEEHQRDGVPDGMKIVFISGVLKDVQGEWNIQPGKPLELTYRMRMDLSKMPFPPPMAISIADQQVKNWVDAFSRELKRIKE